jgi:hypothetical protein
MPTERGWYRFGVKMGVRNLSIVAEPAGDTLPSVQGIIGFELHEGIATEVALKLADLLNQHVASITLTEEQDREVHGTDQSSANSAPPQDDHE